MTLLRASELSLSFGSRVLFDKLNFVIEAEERVGLVGVNGSGKSTLMKVLAEVQRPDTGLLQRQRGARVIYLPQEPVFPEGATIASELEVAQAPLKAALAEHARLGEAAATGDEKALNRMGQLTEDIERLGGWDTGHQARALLDRLGVKDWDRPVSELSGGTRKRVAIAKALLSKADLLMLDEPTNHLDADTVAWLEEELDAFAGALLLVTHDRYFLDGLVDRISEFQPQGNLVDYPGNYQAYLEQKYVALENAKTAQHKRERWIAQEVAWLRKGAEARRTKSKARIERAQKLLAERGFKPPQIAELALAKAPRLSQNVLEARKVSKSFDGRTVLSNVDLIVQPGERLVLLGPNGAGKTTLLRVLLGELKPDSGEVLTGTRTQIAYYDQTREQLDDNQTIYEAAWNDDWVTLGDKKVRLADYLDDLLFPVPMQRQKVGSLSGGERNRLLLARLFLLGKNVLMLDEPTNDLDLVTLNVLERLLLSFSGAVLLVTHDRYFLDKVATGLLVFDGKGSVVRYEGNYALYRRLTAKNAPAPSAMATTTPAPAPAKVEAPKAITKLSYKDQRELDGMEARILEAEQAQEAVKAQLLSPQVASNAAELGRLSEAMETASAEVEKLYARWQVLQEMAEGVKAR
ncbi:MAG: ABC-F family ATP-binding cassette domain-containing protein [Myxococcaceae bacterium]|nr:ABC-F family ATP-binding cassette domain-containing protein [Myxococcaceae bacterium]